MSSGRDFFALPVMEKVRQKKGPKDRTGNGKVTRWRDGICHQDSDFTTKNGISALENVDASTKTCV